MCSPWHFASGGLIQNLMTRWVLKTSADSRGFFVFRAANALKQLPLFKRFGR
jgi:hypothetical protein